MIEGAAAVIKEASPEAAAEPDGLDLLLGAVMFEVEAREEREPSPPPPAGPYVVFHAVDRGSCYVPQKPRTKYRPATPGPDAEEPKLALAPAAGGAGPDDATAAVNGAQNGLGGAAGTPTADRSAPVEGAAPPGEGSPSAAAAGPVSGGLARLRRPRDPRALTQWVESLKAAEDPAEHEVAAALFDLARRGPGPEEEMEEEEEEEGAEAAGRRRTPARGPMKRARAGRGGRLVEPPRKFTKRAGEAPDRSPRAGTRGKAEAPNGAFGRGAQGWQPQQWDEAGPGPGSARGGAGRFPPPRPTFRKSALHAGIASFIQWHQHMAKAGLLPVGLDRQAVEAAAAAAMGGPLGLGGPRPGFDPDGEGGGDSPAPANGGAAEGGEGGAGGEGGVGPSPTGTRPAAPQSLALQQLAGSVEAARQALAGGGGASPQLIAQAAAAAAAGGAGAQFAGALAAAAQQHQQAAAAQAAQQQLLSKVNAASVMQQNAALFNMASLRGAAAAAYPAALQQAQQAQQSQLQNMAGVLQGVQWNPLQVAALQQLQAAAGARHAAAMALINGFNGARAAAASNIQGLPTQQQLAALGPAAALQSLQQQGGGGPQQQGSGQR